MIGLQLLTQRVGPDAAKAQFELREEHRQRLSPVEYAKRVQPHIGELRKRLRQDPDKHLVRIAFDYSMGLVSESKSSEMAYFICALCDLLDEGIVYGHDAALYLPQASSPNRLLATSA